MNINDLTLSQVMAINNMFHSPVPKSPENITKIGADLTGSEVIIRTYSAGVHFGTLTEFNRQIVRLKNTRRIWSWEEAFTLNEISLDGLSENSKLSKTIPDIILTEAIEIIPCSPSASECIRGIKNHD